MKQPHIEELFEKLAIAMGSGLEQDESWPSVRYIALEASDFCFEYIRLCLDAENLVVFTETVVPLKALLKKGEKGWKNVIPLMQLSTPHQTGKRFYPSLDLEHEQLILTYAINSEAIRVPQDLLLIVDACAREVNQLCEHLRDVMSQSLGGQYRDDDNDDLDWLVDDSEDEKRVLH